MNLKNKRIFITAGPTWVPIDEVRVISNIATGETGILLAQRLQKMGARVTLALGPVSTCCLNRNIKLIAFKFFDELKDIITRELKSKKYDIAIQAAAVSDYRPKKKYFAKVKSGIRCWKLDLIPTEKLIAIIKKINPDIFLVGFKFEPNARQEILINNARQLMWQTDSDLIVANSINKRRYLAYILNQNEVYGPMCNKGDLTEHLIKLITDY